MNKDELRDSLHNSVMNITFIKKDGSERIMKCTLNSQYIPSLVVSSEEETLIPKKIRKENDDVISVFDLDKQDWRSIIIENIISTSTEKVI